MTWAEELIREGRQEGLQEGRHEGRQEGLRLGELQDKRAILARQLSRRFTVTDAEREQIQACDAAAVLDDALDEFARGSDKTTILGKLRR